MLQLNTYLRTPATIKPYLHPGRLLYLWGRCHCRGLCSKFTQCQFFILVTNLTFNGVKHDDNILDDFIFSTDVQQIKNLSCPWGWQFLLLFSNPPMTASEKQIQTAQVFYLENLRNQSCWLGLNVVELKLTVDASLCGNLVQVAFNLLPASAVSGYPWLSPTLDCATVQFIFSSIYCVCVCVCVCACIYKCLKWQSR